MNKIISFSKALAGSKYISVFFTYLELAKMRLVFMVMLSTLTGYYVAAHSLSNPVSFLSVLIGTSLVAVGSMALNQYLERETDSKMVRTQNRPLPSGRLDMKQALAFGTAASGIGFLILILGTNVLSVLLAVVTWAAYLFVYTPLKSKTSLSTIAGAVPGALPPLIGWAAAQGALNLQGMVLFLIIFFWQMPHFLAIAWMYREDYERAGLPMLSVVDREGKFVARQMVLNMCALMPVSLLPSLFWMTGTVYFFGAFLLGILFTGVIIYASSCLDLRARYVLRSSILYLAALLLLMVVDKI